MLVLLCQPSRLYSQEWYTTEFSYRTNLPAREVYFVTQDNQGLWYFGTSIGLQQFDGVAFSPFFSDEVPAEISHAACRGGFFLNDRLYFAIDNKQLCYNTVSRKIEKTASLPGVPRFFDTLGGKIIYADGKLGIYELSDQLSQTRFHSYPKLRYCARKGGPYLWLANDAWEVSLYRPGYDAIRLHSSQAIDHMNPHWVMPDGTVKGFSLKSNSFADSSGNINFVLQAAGKAQNRDPIVFIRPFNFHHLFRDRNNLLWLTTSDGVMLIYRRQKQSDLKLPGHSIRGIYEDKAGNLLISSYTGTYIRRKDAEEYIALPEIHSVAWVSIPLSEDGSHVLVHGVNDSKYYVDLKTAQVKVADWIPVPTACYSWLKTSPGEFLLFGYGVFRMNPAQKSFSAIVPDGELTGPVYGAYPLSAGKYLLVTGRGTFVFDLSSKQFRNIDKTESRWVEKITDGQFVIGTMGKGLMRWNPKTGAISRITTQYDAIDRGFPFSGLLDQNGKSLWVGTAAGLFKVSTTNWRAAIIPTRSKEFNTGALFTTISGQLMAGGTAGLEIISPGNSPSPVSDYFSSPPFISGIKSYVAGIGFGERTKYLAASTITIAPDVLATDIVFGSPYALVQEAVQYRYRISGYTDSWTYMLAGKGETPVISLTKLPVGAYTLEIQYEFTDGAWSGSRLARIIAKPAYYQTWVFRISTAVFIMLVIGGVVWNQYRKHENRMRENARILELENRLTQSELVALRSQITPHMFANSLQTAQFFIYNNQKELAAEYLNKYSGLMRKTLEMGAKDLVTLAEEVDYLKSYCSLESLKLNTGVAVGIHCKNIPNPASYLIPSMVIQPFVENAFKHGLRNAETGCSLELRVEFELREQQLICTVFNSGKITELATESGRVSGNTIATARLELYAELFGMKSSVAYVPCDRGLDVVITLPYKRQL